MQRLSEAAGIREQSQSSGTRTPSSARIGGTIELSTGSSEADTATLSKTGGITISEPKSSETSACAVSDISAPRGRGAEGESSIARTSTLSSTGIARRRKSHQSYTLSRPPLAQRAPPRYFRSSRGQSRPRLRIGWSSAKSLECRRSSTVEHPPCKREAGGSSPFAGTRSPAFQPIRADFCRPAPMEMDTAMGTAAPLVGARICG